MNSSLAWVITVLGVVVLAVIVVALVARRRRGRAPSATSLYISALDALLAGDETQALELLRETVRKDSNNVPAYIRLGTLLRLRGQTGRATRIHLEISVRPRVDSASRELALVELALDYTAGGNTEKALATLDELRNLNNRNLFAYEAAAQLMEEKEDWDRAYEFRKQLDRVIGEDGPSLARFQAHVGRELARRGDHKGARDHFKEAFRRDKHSLPAYLYSGDLRYQQGKMKDAVGMWRDVIRHHPAHASWVYKRLEKAYFELGQFETMLDVYEEVLNERPDDVPTLLAVARFHHKKGDLDEAERAVSRILEANREEPLARLYLGLIRAERGNHQAAVEVLEALLQDEIEATEMFTCTRCGHETDEVLWRCPQCGGWRTLLQDDRRW